MTQIEYMTLPEIAQIMGLSTSTLSNYTTRREPRLKISKWRAVWRGQQPLVRREDFEAWREAYAAKREHGAVRGRKPAKQSKKTQIDY